MPGVRAQCKRNWAYGHHSGLLGVLDDAHLYRATRYVELNPVRARLVRKPHRWRWSSAAAHLAGEDDRLVRVEPLLEAYGDWGEFLAEGLSDDEAELLRRHERTGRPLGSVSFVERLERLMDRVLLPRRAGRKRKARQ